MRFMWLEKAEGEKSSFFTLWYHLVPINLPGAVVSTEKSGVKRSQTRDVAVTSKSWDGLGDTKEGKQTQRNAPVTFNITTQVVTHFIQNEIDIFFRRDGMVCNISWSVGSASYSHLLPG